MKKTKKGKVKFTLSISWTARSLDTYIHRHFSLYQGFDFIKHQKENLSKFH